MSTMIKDFMLSTIDNSASAAKALINNFNWDDFKGQFEETRKTLQKKSDELIKSVQTILAQSRMNEDKTEYTVSIPYDKEAGDKILWKVDGGVLYVKVNRADSKQTVKSEYAETIPEGFDKKPYKRLASKSKKTAMFVFKKALTEDGFIEID